MRRWRGLQSLREDVENALKIQKKLGEILVEQGKASPKDIENIIEKQRNRKTESFKNSVSSTIRVDLKKLDHLINIVGEMVIVHSCIVPFCGFPFGNPSSGVSIP